MATDPDLEKIVSLDPDVVVVDQHFKEKVDEVAALGLDIFYFDSTSLDNFVLTIEKLGEEINKVEQATAFINEIKETETSVFGKVKEGEAPTVAVLFRNILAALVGAGLAISGLLLQSVMKNLLADPGITGVSSGATVVAIIIVVVLPKFTPLMPLLSFLGGPLHVHWCI